MGVPGAIDDVQPFAELFQGATTTVYKAYQRSLDRFVLLKRLRPEYRLEEVLSQGLEEEARLIARVQHPNVVAVYAHGRDEQGTYIVAEFVEGVDLRALIEQGRIPHELAAFILRESALGLKAAHEKGVLHRDLKPANILLSHDGAVKLTDFGMASLLSPEPEVRDDDDREIRGTLAYLAPEQVLGEAPSKASDLFSLGATLYELLAGRRAFQGSGPSELFEAVLNYDPLPHLSADTRVPAALVEIAEKLLAKDPSDRYQNCTELLSALDSYRAAGGEVGSQAGLMSFMESPERYVPAVTVAGKAIAPDGAATSADRRPRLMRRAGAGAIGVLVVAGLLYASVSGPALNDVGLVGSEEVTDLADPAPPEEGIVDPQVDGGEEVEPNESNEAPGRDSPDESVADGGEDIGATAGDIVEEAEPTPQQPPASGSILVDVKPYAEVIVGGRSLGTTPLRAELPAGTHEILLRHREFPEHSATVMIRPGEESPLSVSLWALVGQIEVEVAPWGYVYIDDAIRDTVPPQTRPLIVKPGRHLLSIVHPALGRRDTTIVIPAGTTYRFRFNLNR